MSMPGTFESLILVGIGLIVLVPVVVIGVVTWRVVSGKKDDEGE